MPLFEWDAANESANVRKLGVSFELAARIFDGPVWTVIDDRADYGEQRALSSRADRGRRGDRAGPYGSQRPHADHLRTACLAAGKEAL